MVDVHDEIPDFEVAQVGEKRLGGTAATLGGRAIHVRDQAAFLDDGTLAGSTLTMDRAFRNIVTSFRRSLVDAAWLCSTTPARQPGATELGGIEAAAGAGHGVPDRDRRGS